MDLEHLAGTRLGNYEIECLLGQGGMGIVYKARQLNLDRPVALKILPPTLSSDQSFVKRFKREARAVAKLNHSNIVQIHDIAEEQGLHFFSMEYVEGRTLDRILEEKGRLESNEAMRIISQAARALEHAHKNNIIHRDVKPSNIIIDNSGNVKVMDFGLARVVDDRSKVTQSGSLIGTLGYMSPEQCKGEKLDVRSDIYSLGVVLYETLTGRPPFDESNEIALINRVLTEDPPEVSSINPEVPEYLSKVVARSMARDRDKRYESVSEFLRHLPGSGSSDTVELGSDQWRSFTRNLSSLMTFPPGRIGRKAIAIGAVVLALMFLAVFMLPRQKKANEEALNLSAVDASISELLRFAYGAVIEETGPSVASTVMFRSHTNAPLPWHTLKNGDAMSSADDYRILLCPDEEAYIYVFQIDSTGKLDWLFPRNDTTPYSTGTNPVAPNKWTQIPDGKTALHLDENLGIEHIYIVAVGRPWERLEELLKEASMKAVSKSSVRAAFGFRTRGVGGTRIVESPLPPDIAASTGVLRFMEGESGVLVEERWFHHVARPGG